jgi:hypothetical protein
MQVSPGPTNVYDRDLGFAGLVAPSAWWNGYPATGAVAANRTYCARVVPSRNMRIISLAFVTTVASDTNDNVDVGIYNGSGTTKLASSGASASGWNGTGVKNIALSAAVDLVAGNTYYAAIATPAAFGGTTPQLLLSTSTGVTSSLFGASIGLYTSFYHNAGGTLPSPLVVASAVAVPILAIREA